MVNNSTTEKELVFYYILDQWRCKTTYPSSHGLTLELLQTAKKSWNKIFCELIYTPDVLSCFFRYKHPSLSNSLSVDTRSAIWGIPNQISQIGSMCSAVGTGLIYNCCSYTHAIDWVNMITVQSHDMLHTFWIYFRLCGLNKTVPKT